jgi:hypothetical protein
MTCISDEERREAFERAWIAIAYALGRRGGQLTDALEVTHPTAQNLVRALVHPARLVRARVLAAELARLVHLLGQRGLQ